MKNLADCIITPDDRYLISGAKKTIVVWDVETYDEVRTILSPKVYSNDVGFDHKIGALFIDTNMEHIFVITKESGSGHGVLIFDFESGECLLKKFVEWGKHFSSWKLAPNNAFSDLKQILEHRRRIL